MLLFFIALMGLPKQGPLFMIYVSFDFVWFHWSRKTKVREDILLPIYLRHTVIYHSLCLHLQGPYLYCMEWL